MTIQPSDENADDSFSDELNTSRKNDEDDVKKSAAKIQNRVAVKEIEL